MILHALTAGEGPPIILLHGLFGAAKNLGVIARALAPRGKILSLDLRNHGDSPHSPAMTYAIMAGDVAETMAARGLTRATVIGHSMGGKTAMALALSRPGLVERLVVMDIAPVSYNHRYDAYVKAMKNIELTPELTRHDAEQALRDFVPAPPMRAFLLNNLILGDTPHWRIALNEIGAAMTDLLDWADPPGAAPFPGPVLFLRGGNSDYVPDSAGGSITARFPAACIKTVAGTGHWLHAEMPNAVIAELEEFLFP